VERETLKRLWQTKIDSPSFQSFKRNSVSFQGVGDEVQPFGERSENQRLVVACSLDVKKVLKQEVELGSKSSDDQYARSVPDGLKRQRCRDIRSAAGGRVESTSHKDSPDMIFIHLIEDQLLGRRGCTCRIVSLGVRDLRWRLYLSIHDSMRISDSDLSTTDRTDRRRGSPVLEAPNKTEKVNIEGFVRD